MVPEKLVTHSLFLLGEGIGKSLTPAMHEREGRELGMSVSYHLVDALKLGLGPDDLPDVITWAKRLGFTGFNVTHPFKQAIIPHLDGLSDRVEALGAVNTVVIQDGVATGNNTDWCGFQRPLLRQLPDAVGARVVQLGAGGAGSAVAYALLDLGVKHLTVLDMVPGKADELVARMRELYGRDRVDVGSDLAAELADADGVVHCTPTGMATHPGCAVPDELLTPGRWVSEIVYFPLETELLRRARANGCRTVDGGGMAAEQANEAFFLFTGVRPDGERMNAHLRSMVGTPTG
ncbi:MAG: shikimate dehydrogenase [Dermatophilaceae bacterium]